MAKNRARAYKLEIARLGEMLAKYELDQSDKVYIEKAIEELERLLAETSHHG